MAQELTEQIAYEALERLARIKAQKLRVAQYERAIVKDRAFVQTVRPVSKRSAKSAGSKTRTLKVRNWGIKAAHFN